jgi:hypothetical protein
MIPSAYLQTAAWLCAALLAGAAPGRVVAQAPQGAAASGAAIAPAGPADIPALFGNRIAPIPPFGKPFLLGDFDGDGVTDSLYLVRILQAGQGGIALDVTVADPWDKKPVADAGEPLALAIVSGQGQRKFLLHDVDFLSSPIWSQTELPLKIAKKGARKFREFQRQAGGIKNDLLVLGTEAGIDIVLYWDGKKFTLFRPKEEP